MKSLAVVCLLAVFTYCSAVGGPPARTDNPVCDVSQQVDLHGCLIACFRAKISNVFPGDLDNDETLLDYFTCLAKCNLKLPQPTPPGRKKRQAGEPAPSDVDDSCKFTICSNRCYMEWHSGMDSSGANSCFKNRFMQAAVCYLNCVAGGVPEREKRRAVTGGKTSLRRVKRQGPTLAPNARVNYELKIDFALCHLRCYERDGAFERLSVIPGATRGNDKTCDVKDRVIVGRCNTECVTSTLAAAAGRKKRAVNSATSLDRVRTEKCSAICLKQGPEVCLVDELMDLYNCLKNCVKKDYTPGP